MLSILEQLEKQDIISQADYYFAKLIANKQEPFNYPDKIKNLAILLAALCNYNYQQGHTCLVLEKNLLNRFFSVNSNSQSILSDIQEKIDHLAPDQWKQTLSDHIAFTSNPLEQLAPLVFQFDALYFYRAWQDEYCIAKYLFSAVNKQVNFNQEILNYSEIKVILDKYFPSLQSNKIDWQKVAATIAICQPFCLITGGPGTGKTTTVARILAILQSLHKLKYKDDSELRIKLVAPTGKAAARLTESITAQLNNIDKQIACTIPTQAETLHRLLGIRFYEEKTTYHDRNTLPIDILVVDEASMIDLSLMAKLLRALKPQTKLILLGDKDQLASVEAGAILGELGKFTVQGYTADLVDYIKQTTNQPVEIIDLGNPIQNCLCNLVESRRFHQQSKIGHLAKLVNSAQGKQSWKMIQDDSADIKSEIQLINFDSLVTDDLKEKEYQKYVEICVNTIVNNAAENYRTYLELIKEIEKNNVLLEEYHLKQIFDSFNKIRYLTALRIGELGSENLNQRITEKLQQLGLLNFKQHTDWFTGKPVMITQNNANVGLFNGDIGLYIISKNEVGESKGYFWFEKNDNNKQFKKYIPSRIPKHETAFAMTVHKAQGSEFNHAVLVLPTEPSAILSKELVYTGITRAKEQITIFANQLSWENAVSKKTERQSGLEYLLKNMLSIHKKDTD
ncbi:exodeoxyribonuclease V subunit alpha [Seminibacterium arietis]|uniref:RecBCD enzyme subunit RecD n=1 Tax=Seminibacterium arietis TaxID=1173502 RepID=A0ABW3I766_9PAST